MVWGYYMNHGHMALFGTYGMPSIALVLMAFGILFPVGILQFSHHLQGLLVRQVCGVVPDTLIITKRNEATVREEEPIFKLGETGPEV